MKHHKSTRFFALLPPPAAFLVTGCSSGGAPSAEVHFVHPGSTIENSEYAIRRARFFKKIARS